MVGMLHIRFFFLLFLSHNFTGAFSMDGDVAPLDKICKLADKYDALVMVDDSHATGFMGRTGRGTPELHGVTDRIDVVNSTLGVLYFPPIFFLMFFFFRVDISVCS